LAACLHTNQSRSYLNHLVFWLTITVAGLLKLANGYMSRILIY
jgi:hypothetical protein